METDNKFRNFTKVKDFADYKETIKGEIAITASEAQDAKTMMAELKIHMHSQIRVAVNKQVDNIKAILSDERRLEPPNLVIEAFGANQTGPQREQGVQSSI